MQTGFEEHSTEHLGRYALSLTTDGAQQLSGEGIQILARLTAELAARLQRLEEKSHN